MTGIEMMSREAEAAAPPEAKIDRSRTEWLEADGLGGFAMGRADGLRTRRYHGLLQAAMTPPTGRCMLVNGVEAWIETPAGSFAISSQRYAPDVTHPDGIRRQVGFESEPWPRWTFRLENGLMVVHELFVRREAPMVALSWRIVGGEGPATLAVRPLLSGRGTHDLHHENTDFRFDARKRGHAVTWRPYPGVPGILALTNGVYEHAPEWYRNFLYEDERERGLDFTEDLASPGVFRFDLARGEAACVFAADLEALTLVSDEDAPALVRRLRSAERRRRGRGDTRLEHAADAYVAHRGAGRSIVAGYPWFTDWGRDTFIAMRGLCLATGRVRDAGEILTTWAKLVEGGLLPNRFIDQGDSPEFGSVDAALWFVIATHDYFIAAEEAEVKVTARARRALIGAVDAIVTAYAKGTHHGIRMDADGLLACGESGTALTWMDAKVDGRAVTPRIGKPVEVQALWLNALSIAAGFSPAWGDELATGLASFRERFWNPERGCLYDVVDVNHNAGEVDASVRPNQLFAVGGLPMPLLTGERAAAVVEKVEKELWTPLGPRTLATGEPGYRGRYQGGARERDSAYHQGTVWPWLAGAFVEAWVRTHGGTAKAKREARARFLAPLLEHLDDAGLGHLPEIADGDAPHTARGCPFQAWSVGEALRLDRLVLAEGRG